MAENNRPPVAIRIVRPYDTEDEFLQNELETIGKTSVILLGAHPRPTGVILRFEVTLASGVVMIRGEGRVLAHKEQAFRGQPGLSLRFTRLDPKSKSLVDRATAIREAKAAGEPDPMSARAREPPRPPEPAPAKWSDEKPTATGETSAIAEALTQTPEPSRARRRSSRPPRPSDRPRQVELPRLTQEPAPSPEPEPPGIPEPEPSTIEIPESAPGVKAAEAAPESSPLPATPIEVAETKREVPPSRMARIDAPADKDALLARLRERARALPEERVREILRART